MYPPTCKIHRFPRLLYSSVDLFILFLDFISCSGKNFTDSYKEGVINDALSAPISLGGWDCRLIIELKKAWKRVHTVQL